MEKDELISLLNLLRGHHADLFGLHLKVSAAIVTCHELIPGFAEAFETNTSLVTDRRKAHVLEQDLALFDLAIQELRDGKIQIR